MNMEDKIENTFGITKSEQKKDIYTFQERNGLLIMDVAVDREKYKNRLSSYSELLKKYFPHASIYVLARIKERKGLKGFFADLFQNSRSSIMSEMKTFMPNYLVKKGDINLLITQDDENMRVFELPEIKNDYFVFNGYRYRIANERTNK